MPALPQSPPHVLVVDDSRLARHAIEEKLRAAGYRVSTASSVEEALESCATSSYSAVVTDMTMGALGGIQLCRLLRSIPEVQSIPVVMLTASDRSRDRFWARHSGADAFVAKEAMDQQLLPTLASLIPDSAPATATPAPIRPLERLAALLDDLLFAAVLAADVHRLVEKIEERETLGRALVELAGEVVDAPYLVLTTRGPLGPCTHVLARGPWGEQDTETLFSRWGIESRQAIVLGHRASSGSAAIGESAMVPIEGRRGPLGSIVICTRGHALLSTRDKDLVALLAREASIVLESAVLAEQTRVLATTDALTGLANRRAAGERLDHEIRRAARYGSELSIALGDVDRFKSINDQHGHAVGDEVLRVVARALGDATRSTDLVARWGGEEFLVILPGAGQAGARIAAERLRGRVEHAARVAGGPPRTTVSIGVATWTRGTTLEELVERADRALYRAKERGRNRVEQG